MGNFVDRNTREYVESGNDPFYPDPPWLFIAPGSPNETVINNVPQKYWVLEGDTLREATQPEKDAVDAAEATAAEQAAVDAALAELDVDTSLGVQARSEVAERRKKDTAISNRVRETQQALEELRQQMLEVRAAFDAIKSTSGGSDNIRAAIPAAATGTPAAPATFRDDIVPAPSVDVLAMPPLPATFDRLQDQDQATEINQLKQAITDREGNP